ncbi:hypothetical protein EVG20_g8187 [Dentipellis fragilis]|uniref:Uncharacterized protein n=1 Tax=Dentipellis fragilis TaxID=205917 RepID=A0A4Y9YA59_9AGAM|nr:hypothetical protein EVG20_g8187 [Dentipellis fragilis]
MQSRSSGSPTASHCLLWSRYSSSAPINAPMALTAIVAPPALQLPSCVPLAELGLPCAPELVCEAEGGDEEDGWVEEEDGWMEEAEEGAEEEVGGGKERDVLVLATAQNWSASASALDRRSANSNSPQVEYPDSVGKAAELVVVELLERLLGLTVIGMTEDEPFAPVTVTDDTGSDTEDAAEALDTAEELEECDEVAEAGEDVCAPARVTAANKTKELERACISNVSCVQWGSILARLLVVREKE